MTTSICPVCGYVHEGAAESLSPGWSCPACGCSGDRFKPARRRASPVLPAAFSLSSRYLCLVCGYAYDPVQGDPSRHVPPATPFADLPSDWRCPTCGASKQRFAREV